MHLVDLKLIPFQFIAQKHIRFGGWRSGFEVTRNCEFKPIIDRNVLLLYQAKLIHTVSNLVGEESKGSEIK